MTPDIAALADAVLYEGYLLYPYRASALKNQHRYPFGTLYPPAFCDVRREGDAASMQMECAVLAPGSGDIAARLRFLQLSGEPEVREVCLDARPVFELARADTRVAFSFSELCGALLVSATEIRPEVFKLTIRVDNETAFDAPGEREHAIRCALASPQLIVNMRGGQLASLIDPPSHVRDVIATCENIGTWPVLVGDPTHRSTILSAPIILYDHPQVAPESPGDFFDNTEVDELLSLRVLTLTEEEKREVAETDARARDLLERTEALGQERLSDLHGAVRAASAQSVGARVRLRPRGRADIFDVVLDGKAATIEAVETDLEGRTYLAVTIDEDPGRELGAYGHRFFYYPEEVEPL